MQRPVASDVPRPRGRPRNPELEAKIIGASAKVYGAQGWSGFSLDAVARAAGIGKSTLYARWKTAEDLLSSMIEKRWLAVGAIDTGNLEGDLTRFGRLVLSRYLETGAGVARHLRNDLSTYPDLAAKVAPVFEHVVVQSIAILKRGRDRGELREGISPAFASDILLSAMERHAGRMALDKDVSEAALHEYVARVVGLMLHGIATERSAK